MRSTELVAARLVVKASSARPGETLGYEISNLGRVPLMFGAPYALERNSPSGWKPANADMVFRLWGRTLQTGDSYALDAAILDDAELGGYRLRKRLRPEWESVADPAIRDAVDACDRDALELVAEFTVVA